MSKHILLTISILISNRPDTVRKCLDSVQPLLKAVPSELILTDTGCGEQVRSIIEEYTDHIIRFKWCNDFAKARNVGLKQAKGKWFLYLDDDEWFEDTTEIIDFFNSGEYKKYGIGIYAQRNYTNKAGTSYSDLLVGRMTRLEPDLKFVYSIHECFDRVVGKAKKFHAFVHHYGYCYDTEEELHAHAQRNIVPLLKEIKANPRNMKHALQLSQEYNVISEYEKSMEVSRNAIEYARKGPVEERFCLASLYANVVTCLMNLWRFEEAIRTGEEYLKLDELDPLVKALILIQLADVYIRQEKYEEAFRAAQQYWDIYQDYLKDDEKYMYFVTNLTCSCFEPYDRSIALGNGVSAAIHLGKEELAWTWFQAMEVEQHVVFIEPAMVKEAVEKLPDASEAGKDYYMQMCNVFLNLESVEKFVTDIIQARCRQGETLEDKIHLAATFQGCDMEHPFNKIIEIAAAICHRDAGEAYDKAQIEELADWCWEHMAENMKMMKEFDFIALEQRLGLAPDVILERIPYYVWQKELTTYFSQYSQEDAAWWTEKFNEYLTEDSMLLLLWKAFVGIYDAIKEADSEGASMEVILCKIREYADSRISLCEQIYKPEILQSRRDVLSEEDQAAYRLIALEKQINAGDYADAVKEVKELKALLSGLNPVMKRYLEWLSDKMKEQEQEKKKAANEFQILSVGVKLKIRQLTTAGNYEAALAVAQQLSSLMPEDEELLGQIEKLKEMLQKN